MANTRGRKEPLDQWHTKTTRDKIRKRCIPATKIRHIDLYKDRISENTSREETNMRFKDAGIHIKKNMFPDGAIHVGADNKDTRIIIGYNAMKTLPTDSDEREYTLLAAMTGMVIDSVREGRAKRREGPCAVFCIWKNGDIKASLTRAQNILERRAWNMIPLHGDARTALAGLVDALQIENVVIFTEEYGGYFIAYNMTEELLAWMGSQLAPDIK